MSLLARLIDVGPRQHGRPTLEQILEVALLAAVLVIGAVTPRHDASGRSNAPLMSTLEEKTGGGLCIFRRLTGAPCPGCGLTRGVVATMHGEPIEAARLNPLAPLVVLWCAWRLVEASALVFLRRRVTNRIPWPIAWKLYGAALGLYLGFGVVRIVACFLGADLVLS